MAGTFTLVPGSLSVARVNHTATLLTDGTVLIAGGFNSTFNCAALDTCFVRRAELFNPVSGVFVDGQDMLASRNQHTATSLQNGMVLIAGGNNATGYLAGAELYDPGTGTFKLVGSMAQARRQHTATLLDNGKVLVAGGFAIDRSGNHSVETGELYDPAAEAFSSAGVMSTGRTDHTASLLHGGKVLIAGGNVPCTPTLCGTVLNAFATAELYDPAANLFSPTGSMSVGRFQHTATVLSTGLVVIAGGQTVDAAGNQYTPTASIEIYDPATGTFSTGGALLTARASHTASLLGTEQVLFTGGIDANGAPISSAELYTPATRTSVAVSAMTVERVLHTATVLLSGEVVIVGGGNGSTTLNSAEVFK